MSTNIVGPSDWVQLFLIWLRKLWASPVTACDVRFNTAKNGIWTMGSNAHKKWVADFLSSYTDPISKVFGLLQSQEGSTSAYQNYDNMGVTLGTGFGGRGLLSKLAIKTNIPSVLPLPRNGSKYKTNEIESMRKEDFARAWVCNAESPQYREQIANAQAIIFRDHVATYSFPTDNLAVLEFLAHLSWWYPGLMHKGNWPSGNAAVIRALQSYAELAPVYNVKPSKKQIKEYIATMRRRGHNGEYDEYLTPFT